MSKQTIHAAVKRVRAILDEHGASELVPVMVWLPPELAAQVMEMAKPYMGLYAGIPEISVSPAPVPPRAHPGR